MIQLILCIKFISFCKFLKNSVKLLFDFNETSLINMTYLRVIKYSDRDHLLQVVANNNHLSLSELILE